MIRLRDVSVFYGREQILNNIDLEIPRGGITAIIGPNGAGKSTMVSAIARISEVNSGKIEIDNQEITSFSSKEYALKLAFMEQDNTVFARLRVHELVAFGRFPHHQGTPSQSDHAAVEEALQLFDLESMSERFVDTLSGGERQRARAAMCYCQGTDYLLLDEPFNNLDVYYSKQLIQVLRKVAQEHGRTIIVVMHDINQAASNADRIIALKNGSIVANGTSDEVINPEVLESVFGFPIAVNKINGKSVGLYY